MAEDRMLSDEILLGIINSKSGDGGGTSDYSQLSNKPEINGVTLSGDKSASDLSLASLDANGKVPAAQLPSYVDDVINGYLYDGHFYEDSAHTIEITGESGKIYIDLETNKTYRWSGLAFVEISESLALGETASTAYAGDKGKANADAITAIKDGQTIDSFGDVENALAYKADKSSVKTEFIGTTAEWNALTTAQKKEYDTYQLTDDYTEGSGGLPNYSTTEQKTGQKWIDGKDIYRKTVEFGALPASTQKDVSSGLTGVTIIKMDAVATSSDDTLFIPYNAANNFIGLLYVYATNSVRIWGNTDLSNHNAVVTLYYTKTA